MKHTCHACAEDFEIIDGSNDELEIEIVPSSSRELELDDAVFRRAMSALPGIVKEGLKAAIEHEVRRGLRRAAGRVD
jgi:hypothetical protein